MRFTSAIILSLLPLSMANAQATLTLEDFDLNSDDTVTEATAPSAMESCLLNSASCTDSGFQAGVGLSLDDVMNLGIIDREEIPTQVVVNGKSVATDTVSSQTLPSIDIEVLFDYNSDALRFDQTQKLSELARVLRNEKFNGFNFVFLGHTDAKGGAAYNRELSSRRAESVANYVRFESGLSSDRMIASGLGFSQLRTPNDPLGAQNRRVQLVLVPRKN